MAAGTVLADGAVVAIGRGLAYCVYPLAAWRRLSGRGRILLLSTYFGASYLLTLTVLLIV